MCPTFAEDIHQRLLGDGSQFGICLSYAEQPEPGGLAQAFHIGAEFLEGGPACLVLGDNIFYGQGFRQALELGAELESGALVFGYHVRDPERYGVVEFDEDGKVLSLEEKPKVPKSTYAIPGIYFYDNHVTEYAANLKPSARGELEITDLNKHYLEQSMLSVQLLGRGIAWLDTGTNQSLMEASQYVQTIEQRQNLKISCLEEIAWRKGWISSEELFKQANSLGKSEYGDYLRTLI